MTRPIHEIAAEIRRDWKPVNYAAAPYLDAMADLDTLAADRYGCDSALSIVLYFLGNASAWRGDVARRIKVELYAMLKGPRQ